MGVSRKNIFLKEKKMKRIVLISAALVIAGALVLSGCGGNKTSSQTQSGPEAGAPLGQVPILKEKLTYTMAAIIYPNWGDPNNGEFYREWEKETNIHINWLVIQGSEAADKYSIMMSSGDYPDAFFGGFGGGTANILRYGVQQGVYIPITKLIPENMPHFLERAPKIDPQVISKQTAPNGEIYSLPGLYLNDSSIPNAAFINKTWLDKLGLKVPTTTEEFAAVLRAFKTRDPNGNGAADEIPLSFKFTDWGAYDHTSYFGAFGYPLADDLTVVDRGTVVFQGAAPSFRAGAEYFSRLYSEGLIDREAFTMTEAQIVAKQNADPMVLGVFDSWGNYSKNHFDDYVLLMPLKGPNGDQNWLLAGDGDVGYSRDQFIITSKAKNPEILLRWADQYYRDFPTGFTAMMGIGPDPNKFWNYDASGNVRKNDTYPPEYERGMQQLAFPPVALEPALWAAAVATSGVNKDKIDYTELYSPYVQKYSSGEWENFPAVVFLTEEENEELSVLQTEINSYAKNQLARWISGDGNVAAEWDSYLRELDAIGLEKYLQLKQTIYNRFKGK
jgi:putative aldouronate transport system substrate-binding protein